MKQKLMTGLTAIGWLAVLIGAAAVVEDAGRGIIVAAVGLVMMTIGSQCIEGRNDHEAG